MEKLVVILGPTSSGKSDLAVELARAYKGEVVSADSRQVYTRMDLGTGKITKKEMKGVPHHLLNIASPKRRFTVAQYQKQALRVIHQIQKRGNLAFLVGGSPQYLYSVIDNVVFPEVQPNAVLRKELEKLDMPTLFQRLQDIDPKRAQNIEAKNKRRLVRALEINLLTGRPVPSFTQVQNHNALLLGIQLSQDELHKRIMLRLKKRLRQGMIKEIQTLKDSGLSWNRLEEFGLEYRYIARHLQKKISRDEMISMLTARIEQYAKSQRKWFQRDERIKWITSQKEARRALELFLD